MGLYNNSIIIFDRGYYSEDMFRELKFYRWPVELKYKELKSRFAMEEFSGATVVSIPVSYTHLRAHETPD